MLATLVIILSYHEGRKVKNSAGLNPLLNKNEGALLIDVFYKTLMVVIPFICLQSIWLFSILREYLWEIILLPCAFFLFMISMILIKRMLLIPVEGEGNG